MANLTALRDYLAQLMRARDDGRAPLTVNALFEALQRSSATGSPVSRTTLYGWFRQPQPQPPTAALLECIPVFSALFGVSEYEFYHLAEILPPEIETAASLLAAANDFRHALSTATKALANAGLSSDGVAIVVDRIMNCELDFKITIWPIVRGYAREIHLHSWLVLEPVEPVMSRRRRSLTVLTSQDTDGQRQYIRRNVITETLWRSLGLSWRTGSGPEWPYGDLPPLCIQVPFEERNRLPLPASRGIPQVSPQRILALSAPFGHAELIAALVGGGLGFGTIDLRYQGFAEPRTSGLVTAFCKEKLADHTSRYAWSICEASEIMNMLADDIATAAGHHLVIGIFSGPLTRKLGAEVWDLSSRELLKCSEQVTTMLSLINERYPIITIGYAEADYISGTPGNGELHIDFNLLTDHVRYSAAEVLNLVYQKCSGPPASAWGSAFDDLRYGTSAMARVPHRGTRVRWCQPGEFQPPP